MEVHHGLPDGDSMAAPDAAADAHRLAALSTPDGEKPLTELSPMKGEP